MVGGGISGLVAAYRLSQARGISVTLFEAAEELGGKIATVPLDDTRVELGADSFLPRDDGPLQLCRDLGVDAELVEPSGFGGLVWFRGKLTPLPSGTVLGFPASLRSLREADILTVKGKLRAAAERFQRRHLRGGDVSVGEFTRKRFGSELLERVVDPLLAGTRAGDVEEMSLAAAIPPVDAAARSHRSVIEGLSSRSATSNFTPRFFAPREGMQQLVAALESSITGEIRRSTPVEAMVHEGDGLSILTEEGSVGCDGVILATPAHHASAVVSKISPQAAWHLDQIAHVSCAVVNLLFPPGAVTLPPSGSGVLIPSSEAMTISGCTWFSRKWPALASPTGAITIRCFVGRGARDPALDLDDRDLTGVVLNELSTTVSVTSGPLASLVARWNRALPAYRVGHLERVDRIETLLATEPIEIAGASYRGTGIPDCIAQAERAATRLSIHLRR